jgi:hypothetical protein
MRLTRKNAAAVDREPMGIVIADGGQPETATRFLAFVWGPGPDEDEDEVREGERRAMVGTA